MGKITGFKEYPRKTPPRRPVEERVCDFRDVYLPLPLHDVVLQAARCMDCGVPFCQSGCPLGNIIPEFNDLVYQENWLEAWLRLRSTNNFPEFTGRICPAPCESACVLGITDPPVAIELIEKTISDRAYEEGWAVPRPPRQYSGRRVAVVGSGPAGLACADQLNQAGHEVTVYERDDRIGGLLRYGIPDFKLEKFIVDRRLALMQKEGVHFVTGAHVGVDLPARRLLETHDALVLCLGATRPRDLLIPGRDLQGIHFAWPYLRQQNKRVAGDPVDVEEEPILATGKDVIVIGGGDTGSDCTGTAHRQGARSVTQFELLPEPPQERPPEQPWPFMPRLFTVSASHEEGGMRVWQVLTRRFIGNDRGEVVALETVDVEWYRDEEGRLRFREIPGTERRWPAQLVLIAIGYAGPEPTIAHELGLELDNRGNIHTDENYRTSMPGVFAAGDARRGQSLVVWAIHEGREAARAVDAWLMGDTVLPSAGEEIVPRLHL